MVKAKQKSIRVFAFEESKSEEMIAYLRKNSILLRSYLLLFKGTLQQEVHECLKSEGLRFLEEFESKDQSAPHQAMQETTEQLSQHTPAPLSKEINQDSTRIPTLVLRRTVRSGEEIIAPGDVTIFGRINSGARICAQGNVQVFGEIQGIVECEGEYMILGKITQGSVLFGGEILDSALFNGALKEVYIQNGSIVVEEVT